MQNPKTTVAGYVLIAGAVLTFVGKLLSGGHVELTDLSMLMAALAGLGLVAAKDGGH